MATSDAVAKRLMELCNDKGWTPNRLSTEAAVRQSTVADILNGRTKNTGILTIKKLCDGLNVSLAEFFNTEVFEALEQEIE